MQTLFEVLFILAFVLPPAAVAAGVCALLGSSFINVRSHGRTHIAGGRVLLQHAARR